MACGYSGTTGETPTQNYTEAYPTAPPLDSTKRSSHHGEFGLELAGVDGLAVAAIAQVLVGPPVDRVAHRVDGAVAEGDVEAGRVGAAEGPELAQPGAVLARPGVGGTRCNPRGARFAGGRTRGDDSWGLSSIDTSRQALQEPRR